MAHSKTARDGMARIDALERRNAAMRDILGMVRKPKPETEKPDVPKADEKPNEPMAPSP